MARKKKRKKSPKKAPKAVSTPQPLSTDSTQHAKPSSPAQEPVRLSGPSRTRSARVSVKAPLINDQAEVQDEDRLVIQFSEFVYLRAFFLIGLVAFSFYVIFLLRNVLAPVLIALALAYLINPIVDGMQQRGMRRNVAIWSLVAVVFLFCVLGWLFFVPKLISSIERLGILLAKVPPLLIKGKVWMESTFDMQFPKTWVEALNQWGNEIKNVAPGIIAPLRQVVTALFSGGMGILSWFFTLMLIPLFTFYFLRGYDNLRHQIVDYIPLQIRDRLLSRMAEIDRILSGFIRGQLTVSLIVGSMYLILLSVVQLPLSPAIATAGAVLNVVPYLGFFTTYLVALIAALVEFHLQWQFFVVLIGMMGIHMIDVLYITPTVVGDQVGLSEIVVIFAVLAGGQLFGLIGVLLAIPLAAVTKVAMIEALEIYRKSRFYTGSSEDS